MDIYNEITWPHIMEIHGHTVKGTMKNYSLSSNRTDDNDIRAALRNLVLVKGASKPSSDTEASKKHKM